MRSKYGKSINNIINCFNYCNNRNINFFLGAKYYKDYEKAKETQGCNTPI